MNTENVALAIMLTGFAGLSTGIGSALAFFTRKTNTRFLSASLGFSAGVMVYVAMIEIFDKARCALVDAMGPVAGAWATAGAFLAGMVLMAVIDRLVPAADNPHEARRLEDMTEEKRLLVCTESSGSSCAAGAGPMISSTSVPQVNNAAPAGHLMRMGLFTAMAVAIHNFPEGLATFASALKDPALGVAVALAVAIHNIPEGIAVSVPVYFATGDRRRAFMLSFLSGLSEPAGALIGYILLFRFFNDVVFGVLFGVVAGIMVFISLDELLPTAREYGEPHLAIYGLIAGMAVMATSLLLLK